MSCKSSARQIFFRELEDILCLQIFVKPLNLPWFRTVKRVYTVSFTIDRDRCSFTRHCDDWFVQYNIVNAQSLVCLTEKSQNCAITFDYSEVYYRVPLQLPYSCCIKGVVEWWHEDRTLSVHRDKFVSVQAELYLLNRVLFRIRVFCLHFWLENPLF